MNSTKKLELDDILTVDGRWVLEIIESLQLWPIYRLYLGPYYTICVTNLFIVLTSKSHGKNESMIDSILFKFVMRLILLKKRNHFMVQKCLTFPDLVPFVFSQLMMSGTLLEFPYALDVSFFSVLFCTIFALFCTLFSLYIVFVVVSFASSAIFNQALFHSV